ncbi:DEAD/DEAH box helicase family protein [Collimonas arenae]|uniref:DEAD/DEAH box helicase family protein n=1 Tax=Collimonas arenae TaxID=279058 RepID=A0A127QDA7_9BURK|nr:ATP-dependent DNA helicase [Collimonas arenae]AMO98192.1 DEAD/DEAH box helicase family protein [Collimonas arenae]AMP08063.1 DEAD/DEAH box helicase family protein [Collimonas arenae]
MSEARYVVAVRALCDFTAKQGDLDLRFTPGPSAQEGIAGHIEVATRRGAGYEAEVSLSGSFGPLLVRGRADGYDPVLNRLEEIKTFRGDLGRMPDNHRHLHWAQIRIYGHLLCQSRNLSELQLALVYYDIGKQKETLLTEYATAGLLQQFFQQQCGRFLAWAEQEMAHRLTRDEQLAALRFPHADFRPGQRALAEAVYKGASSGRCLLAQAPTGIGKTIGTLFPLLKASPAQRLDKLFFLSAKTSGRALALDALTQIRRSEPALPLRVLELVARDKACEHPDKACHGESCPLAQGFYDRLPQARAAAVDAAARGAMDREGLRAVAAAYRVCPYYLSQEMAHWADVIVGDYNYYFDLGGMLHGMSAANQWRVGVLVDEAHNMIERARKMYSAEMVQSQLKVLRQTAPTSLKRTLDRVNRQWNALYKEQREEYLRHADLPDAFLGALQQAVADITDYMVEHPAAMDSQLQGFYFDALHFTRMAELFDKHSLFDVTVQGGYGATLCIRNIVPAPFLAPRFAAAHSTVLFSATLSPWHFYSDTLGMPADTAWVDVPSPFAAEQLSVRLVTGISTRFQQRDNSLSPIVDLIAQQYRLQAGNYLAFFSSYDYLQKVAGLFAERYPEIPLWQQARRMDEHEREAFLARFTESSQGVGFAVLGGAFAEGIDLPGARLIGAFIATLGLPQINPVNEQIMRQMEQTFGNGYDCTYLFPGMQKVVQAAGRVIRTREDRGVVYLIDDRFARREVRQLLPQWWRIDT